ncbi:V-type ATP synthase subunit E family protein [Methanospirillum sp.]|uniref:V-type ATP synthase subunit E family protein n=1 Tax=Methanospirillum sp. TaxID=45200 RepID=UPI002984FF6D|nr:V-type ATP synthase subunit E family protein [Methanospirillum sp.]
MGLEAVIAEIKEKGRNTSETILKEAETKKVEILNIAQQKSETIKVAAQDEVERFSSHIISQEEAAGHLAVKREFLNKQKELMDEVYQEVFQKISDMPESFHQESISSLLKKAKEEIKEGKVSCCARDEKALKAVLTKSEFSEFSFGQIIDIDGGIIVESEDGNLQVDFSYRTFLSQIWESGLKEASDTLFG